MKEHGEIILIGIDHGYGNIKTASTCTPTGITAYDTEPIFSENILEYKGIYYRIGDTHKEFVDNKVSDEDYYLLTLMAIARELHTAHLYEAKVHLAVGLPLTWIYRQKEEFRQYMLKNEYAEFKWNSELYKVHITGCSVYPQGYPAILGKLNDSFGLNLLADIGNGTMNLIFLDGKKPDEKRSFTEKLGVNQCVIAVRDAVSKEFQTTIDERVIQQVLRRNEADISEAYLEVIRSTAREYAKKVFAALREHEYNPDLMRLYIVGGGGCIIKNFGDYDASRVTIIDDICATAKGYELLAYLSLNRKKECA